MPIRGEHLPATSGGAAENGGGWSGMEAQHSRMQAVFGYEIQNSKKKNSASVWRLKSKRNKKCIATAVCKWRDKSNELNQAVIRC